MKPIKSKYLDSVSIQWSISKKSKEIISQHSKYTKYDENEIIDLLIKDILDDKDFIKWLKSRRYTTKVNKLIFNNNDDEPGDEFDEEDETISQFKEF